MRTDLVRHGQFWGVLVGLVLSGGLSAASVFVEQTKEPPAAPQSPPSTLEDLLQAAKAKPTPPVRQPLPDPAAVQKALKLLEEVYKEDIAAAKTPQKKRALAGRLMAEALHAQIPAEQFALLQAARQWAVQTGDVAFALRAVEAMIERFQVDGLAIKAEVLEALSKPGISASPVELAEAVEPLVQEAIDQDAYDMAVRLSRLALTAARRSRNPMLIKRLVVQNKQVEQSAKAWQKVQAALAKLQENPKDPQANLLVGRYLCLEKGRWSEGLAYLAQGADASLGKLAADDLAHPTESAKQLTLAEAWYERAQEEKDSEAKAAMLGRSAYWYEQALPNLTGLDKLKAQRRIDEARAAAPKTPAPLSAPRHYLDPQNRKNIAVLWWSGGWRGDGSKFLQIEKQPDGAYRLIAHPEPEWVVLVFPKIPLAGARLKLSYTLEKGDCRLNVRNMQLESHPPRVIFPEGKHSLETWLEGQQIRALLDGRPVEWLHDDPRHYVHYDLSLRGGTIVTIHQFEVLPVK